MFNNYHWFQPQMSVLLVINKWSTESVRHKEWRDLWNNSTIDKISDYSNITDY
jgi:hypothetical protein